MPALRRPNSGQAGDANVVALLSLKLLLLAFFIMLTAIARFEQEKVDLVVTSVNDAFDGRIRSDVPNVRLHSGLGSIPASTQLTERIRNLFSSTLPAARVERDDLFGELRIKIPTEALFFAEEARLRAGPTVLLSRLARLLGPERPAATDYDLEMLVGVDRDALSRLSSTPDALASRRAGTLARDFARRGMPADKLSVGLVPGAQGKVRLVLRVRDLPSAGAER